MADHYRKAVEHVETVHDLIGKLDQAHSTGAAPKQVAGLYDRLNWNLKLADVHANLATVQALHDQELVR